MKRQRIMFAMITNIFRFFMSDILFSLLFGLKIQKTIYLTANYFVDIHTLRIFAISIY